MNCIDRKKITRRRQQLNLTQADVAKKMGSIQARVSQLENSLDTDPLLSTLEKLASALGLGIRSILVNPSEKSPEK